MPLCNIAAFDGGTIAFILGERNRRSAASMDHKALISGLAPRERAVLTTRSDGPGLRHLAGHLGAIGIGAVLILAEVPFWPLIMVLQGIAICFLFTALHETCHGTAFKTPALNVWVGRICAALTLLGPEWFRLFHMAHHRHTHDPAHDPELASPKPETPLQYGVHILGLRETSKRVTTLFRNATQPNRDVYVPKGARARVQREARVLLAIYGGVIAVSVAAGSTAVLMVWALPFLLGAPFLRAYLLAEHVRCPHVANMLENTRKTRTTRLMRALAWNMPYHAEHHAYPTVPFHKLPALHRHTEAHLSHHQDGYVGFNRDYVAQTARAQDHCL